jgi:hypothetical protein
VPDIPKDWNGCNNCEHLERWSTTDRRSSPNSFVCAAFPDGISMLFLSGQTAHLSPTPGQRGTTVWQLRSTPIQRG